MKKVISTAFFSLMVVLLSTTVFAAGEPSVELGKKLFNNPGLGASQNAISCNTCHPGGKDLEDAGKKSNLVEMINRCIAGPLKGQALFEDTPAMKSLVMYIKSVGQ